MANKTKAHIRYKNKQGDIFTLGEIRKAQDIGYKTHYAKYIWHACLTCGKERWVAIVHNKPSSFKCQKCGCQGRVMPRGIKSPFWKGGKTYLKSGYVSVQVYTDSPYHSMANEHHTIGEHRLIMAQQLGRCLLSSEHVHHKNGIRSDNRLENLELISPANHIAYKSMCTGCSLRKEIRLLRWQIKDLSSLLQGTMRI